MEDGAAQPAGEAPRPEGPATPITARRALEAPSTINREARTVEVIFSAGTRAENWVPGIGRIVEELDMSANAVRMGVLKTGRAPVLDTHNSWGARSVLGVVAAARVDRGRGIATLQFSRAADVEPIWQRIVEGTLRSVSVGYRVFRYEQRTDPATGQTIHRAVDWEPFEISVVPIPVDAAAGVRGEADGGRPVAAIETPIPETENIMSDMPNPAAEAAGAASPAAASQTIQQPAAGLAPQAAAEEAVRAERARIASLDPITVAARGLLPEGIVNDLRKRAINDAWAPEAFRSALFDALVQNHAQRPTVPAQTGGGADHTDPAGILDAMSDALAVRAFPGFRPANDRHREFMGWRPSDMIRELLIARGERNPPRLPALLAERAFHTTSDFPLLLSAAANKALLAAYQPAAPTYRRIGLRRDFRDFKPHRYLRLGDFPQLEPLLEGGEIRAGTVSESQETVTLATFARRVRVTRHMLVNDDLGAFTDFAGMIGRRIPDFENATFYGLVNTANGDGPTLATGNAAVFGTGAARANRAATGSAIDIAGIAAGRAAMMRQRTLDGLPIALGEQVALLVGPNQELAARQMTIPVAATQTGQANVFAGFVVPIVEPLIPGNRWYLFADPSVAPVYTYGFLNGSESPQVTTSPVQGIDGVEVQVIHDFGVGAIDFRGAWFNPGV